MKPKFKTEQVLVKDLKYGDMVAIPSYKGEGVVDIMIHVVSEDTRWFLMDEDSEDIETKIVDKIMDEDADLIRLQQ